MSTRLFCGSFLAGMGAALALFLAPPPALAQMCERPLCDREDEAFTRSGVRDGRPYGVCQGEPNWLGHRSHRLAECPAGWVLNTTSGLCVDGGCSGGCGQRRPVCPWGTDFQREGENAEGRYAVCGSRSGLGGYVSHQLVRCREGWRLVEGGQCEKECGFVSAPVVDVLRADLVITSAQLRTRSGAAPPKTWARGQSYLACFTVANRGMRGSGPFRVSGGGLGVPVAPYQNHAALGPGDSRDGCLEYSTTPGAGSYKLVLTADSRHSVVESREDNNTYVLVLRVGL